jgi:hypothetical protein
MVYLPSLVYPWNLKDDGNDSWHIHPQRIPPGEFAEGC